MFESMLSGWQMRFSACMRKCRVEARGEGEDKEAKPIPSRLQPKLVSLSFGKLAMTAKGQHSVFYGKLMTQR